MQFKKVYFGVKKVSALVLGYRLEKENNDMVMAFRVDTILGRVASTS